MDKVFLVSKPLGWTCMDVIAKLRSILKIKKIGHAGTLDPLATGLLIVCSGKKTKEISKFMDMQKEYIADIDLSAFSQTDDAEGPIEPITINRVPQESEVHKVIEQFVGTILQVPPKFSAIKIQGKRAYKKARNNEAFQMPPRFVTINSIEIVSYNWPSLIIKVNCGKGTYIRSLARDIGTKLGVGGYLTALRRTAIGQYQLKDALTLEQIQANTTSLTKQ